MKSKRYPIETLKDWTERCMSSGRNLTKWEQDFVESLDDQLRTSGSLSLRQEEILESIYTAKVP